MGCLEPLPLEPLPLDCTFVLRAVPEFCWFGDLLDALVKLCFLIANVGGC